MTNKKILVIVFSTLFVGAAIYAQIPTLLGNPVPTIPNRPSGTIASTNEVTLTAPNTPTASSLPTIFIPGMGTGSSVLLPYDPMIDNKLKSPPIPQGMFGRPVREVERRLEAFGAKPYSYAFGKYSRMTFSVYIITLKFDKKRKLGAVSIQAKPPFSKVESKAREFFMDFFLSGADLSQFETKITPSKIEISYYQNSGLEP